MSNGQITMTDEDWAEFDSALARKGTPPPKARNQAERAEAHAEERKEAKGATAVLPAASATVSTPDDERAIQDFLDGGGTNVLTAPQCPAATSAEGGARVEQAVAKLAGKDEPPKRKVRTAEEVVAAQAMLAIAPEQPTAGVQPATPTAISAELEEIRAARSDIKDLTNWVLVLVNRKGPHK